jgi:hypothetical protein
MAGVPRSGVCTSAPTHLFSRSASKTVPRWPDLPLRACVPRSGVCTSAPTHLQSRSASKTVPRMAGLAPASVCSTLRCVHFSACTPLFSSPIPTCRGRELRREEFAGPRGLRPGRYTARAGARAVLQSEGVKAQDANLALAEASRKSRGVSQNRSQAPAGAAKIGTAPTGRGLQLCTAENTHGQTG